MAEAVQHTLQFRFAAEEVIKCIFNVILHLESHFRQAIYYICMNFHFILHKSSLLRSGLSFCAVLKDVAAAAQSSII